MLLFVLIDLKTHTLTAFRYYFAHYTTKLNNIWWRAGFTSKRGWRKPRVILKKNCHFLNRWRMKRVFRWNLYPGSSCNKMVWQYREFDALIPWNDNTPLDVFLSKRTPNWKLFALISVEFFFCVPLSNFCFILRFDLSCFKNWRQLLFVRSIW